MKRLKVHQLNLLSSEVSTHNLYKRSDSTFMDIYLKIKYQDNGFREQHGIYRAKKLYELLFRESIPEVVRPDSKQKGMYNTSVFSEYFAGAFENATYLPITQTLNIDTENTQFELNEFVIIDPYSKIILNVQNNTFQIVWDHEKTSHEAKRKIIDIFSLTVKKNIQND